MIKTLLAEATSYQGHEIAVAGIAKDVEARPPMPACKHMLRYGDYVFDLKDESGSIRVEVMGMCGIPRGGVKIVRDGDRVLVKGVFIQLLSGNLSSPTMFISALTRAVSRLPDNIDPKPVVSGLLNVKTEPYEILGLTDSGS